MAALRFLFYMVVVVVLGGGWAFFYMQSGASDLAVIDAARSAANALRAIDSRWSDQLVAARAGGAFEPAPHGVVYANLEVRALRVPYAGIGLALVGVKNAFDEKANAMRRIARRDGHFEEAWLAPTGPRLDLLMRVLDRAFDEAVLWTELYRAWLLYYTVFLVTLLVYALYRIRTARVPAAR